MDHRLRLLERRFVESGAPADELALLLERVRTGRLTRERVELAAWLGHPAAQLLPRPHTAATRGLLERGHTGDCAVVAPQPPPDLAARLAAALQDYLAVHPGDWVTRYRASAARRRLNEVGLRYEWPGTPPVSLCPLCRRAPSLRDWVGALRRWGTEAVRRSALAQGAFAAQLPRAGRWVGLPVGERLRQDLEQLRAWIACPCRRHERELVAVEWLAQAASGRLAQALGRLADEVALRGALRRALVPWALSQRAGPPPGPVRPRVARGRAGRATRLAA